MANRFVEISKLVQSPDNVRKDMGDALELAREHFRGKYLRRIQKTVESERLRALANPPKEVALIAALKEFAPPESHENYDRIADLFIMLSSWKEIRRNLELSNHHSDMSGFDPENSFGAHGQTVAMSRRQSGYAGSFDESVHPDGVYDIDHECSASGKYNGGRLAEMMFLLSMLGK